MKENRSAARRWIDNLLLWPLRLFGRRRLGRLVLERIGDRAFLVLPDVFNPMIFRSSRVLAEYIARAPDLTYQGRRDARALDLGTGSGIQAVFVAARGFAVTATDVNPEAVRCAQLNALLNRVEDKVRVLEGDLFAPVEGEDFDLVIFNPPFFPGTPRDALDKAWRSLDSIERFAAGLPSVLRPDGVALVIWSSHADPARLTDSLHRSGLTVTTAHTQRAIGETMTILAVRRST